MKRFIRKKWYKLKHLPLDIKLRIIKSYRDMFIEWPQYTGIELISYYKVYCPKCGWKGLSRDTAGGNAIADTGDYSDIVCPECYSNLEDVD